LLSVDLKGQVGTKKFFILQEVAMPTFPTTEDSVLILANRVIAGLTLAGGDFPNVSIVNLEAAVNELNSANNQCQMIRSAAKQATNTKNEKANALRSTLRKALDQATLDNPLKLSELGWSLPAPPSRLQKPDMADNLTAIWQGDHEVSLVWDKPKSGGKVAAYILQRQIFEEGLWSNWHMVQFFYDNAATITNQPTGVKMRYQIIASNDAGQSNPSNMISVVL
jgi:hypothetical protein